MSAQRICYVVWQSRRKQDRQTQGLVADQDYPDRLTPTVTLTYHTGLDAGDIFRPVAIKLAWIETLE